MAIGVSFLFKAYFIKSKSRLIAEPKMVRFAVCGAHLSGQPLNKQLTECGAIFVSAAKTAPVYQFYALPDDNIKRPGLVRQNRGKSIDLELWDIPEVNLGTFIANIHAPLGAGRVDGLQMKRPRNQTTGPHAS